LRGIRNPCRPQECFTEQTQLGYLSESIFEGHKDFIADHRQDPRKVFSAKEMPNFAKTFDQTPDEAPKVELKPLLAILCYEFFGPNESYPVIINANLNDDLYYYADDNQQLAHDTYHLTKQLLNMHVTTTGAQPEEVPACKRRHMRHPFPFDADDDENEAADPSHQ
jgi:hypothetical protein